MALTDGLGTERLLPTEKKYSVAKLDAFEPPTSEDAAVKLNEVDDLAEANVPEQVGTGWLAYDRDEEGYRLPVDEDDSE